MTPPAPSRFDLAFATHRGPLWGFLLRLCGRAELAEELLQETFVRYAAHAERLGPDANVRAWLFTVARNLYRSHRRWAWVDGQRLAELAARAVGVDPGPTPLELLAASETSRRAERAMAALPDGLREIAALVLVERLEPQEAAAILGLSPEAARQRLARARAAIRQALEPGGTP